jgi:hypothetical protein
MLAPLPDEVAAAALATISQVDNTLVDAQTEQGDFAATNPGTFTPPRSIANPGQANQSGGSTLLGLVCMFMLVIFVGAPIIVYQVVKHAR